MLEKKITNPIHTVTIAEILQVSEGQLLSPLKELVIKGVASPEKATENDLIFFNHIKYSPLVKESKAGICITFANLAEYVPKQMFVIVSENPYKAYALVAQKLYYA